ncbi:MAG: glycoside hydrolase family 28 protein [Clostridia bacterium]|nr:glycoside hydrolase family 28 protein [Clostridia bacterium]
MKLLFAGARSASVLLDKSGDYFMPAPVTLYLNGEPLGEERRSMVSLFDLRPETDYQLTFDKPDGERARLSFRTEAESYTLDVRRFGARGDGEADDTPALQAAILSCPPGGRVLLEPGTYVSGPLFLKSHITLELRKGATLALCTDESRFPVLPGVIFPTGEGPDLLLGTHEGNPLDARAAALTGVGVEDVRLVGEGVIDGRAQEAGWWINTKERYGIYRPSLLLLERCRNVTVQGLTFRNSPFWNIHPMFSEDLSFLNILVEAPAVSPNTDGFDPESCRRVRLMGALLSVGDDCIALKSGKIWQGRTLKMPCEDIEIAYCAMLDGHGGVTVGSEMAGGIRRVRVHHCWMRGNDRGLRIKSRRGRGKQAVVDDIRFEDIRMEGVKMPLVVNCMYFCDPDGHAPFVQSREPQPVDEGTPTIGSIIFRRVRASGCQACVGYLLGLPERPVDSLLVRDCAFSFEENAPALVPAMSDGVPAVHNRGILAYFIRELTVENVTMDGIEGPQVVQE